MSEWVRAKGEAKAEFKEMDKAVAGYSYKEPKHAESTDNHVKRLIADELNKSKDSLFPMIEAAYMEKDWDDSGALEDVMQWIDVFLLELGLPLQWDEKAGCRSFVKVIKADVTLLRNSRKLASILEKMNEQVMGGRGGSAVRKSAQLKKFIADMLGVFKKRRHALGG